MNWQERAELFWRNAIDSPQPRVCVDTPDIDCPKEPVPIVLESMGMLQVPTGRLIACDPNGARDPQSCPPLKQLFPPGRWPATLIVVEHASPGVNGTPVAAMIRFGEKLVDSWQVAEPVRYWGSPAPNEDGSIWAVPIDGGIAAFIDQAGVIALGEAAQYWSKNWQRDDTFDLPSCGWRNLELKGSNPAANAVVFRSGVGDGCYPCFVGYVGEAPIVLLMLFDTFAAERMQ